MIGFLARGTPLNSLRWPIWFRRTVFRRNEVFVKIGFCILFFFFFFSETEMWVSEVAVAFLLIYLIGCSNFYQFGSC